MEKVLNKDGTAYVATNAFDDESKKAVDELLNDGVPVEVIPDCIGHTRAEMIDNKAKKYLKERGAKQVEIVKHYSIGDFKQKYWVL